MTEYLNSPSHLEFKSECNVEITNVQLWNFSDTVAQLIAKAARFYGSGESHTYHAELGEKGTLDMYNRMADGFDRYSDLMSDEDILAYEEAMQLFVQYHPRMWD